MKTDKEKKSATKTPGVEKAEKVSKKASNKPDIEEEDDMDDAEEVDDDWGKEEEDSSWDPDFEEFDMPKSKAPKKSTEKTKKGKEEEDEFNLDEDLGLGDDDLFEEKDEFDDHF